MEISNKNTSLEKFNLALIQMKSLLDKKKNLERAEAFISTAVNLHSAQVIILPEFFNTPLGLKPEIFKTFVEKAEDSETVKFLSSIAKKFNIYIIGGSIPVYFGEETEKVFNSTFCFDKKGEISSKFSKLHLFDVDIPGKIKYQESKKITPGNDYGIFETEYGRFGLGICYDVRFIEYALLLKKEFHCNLLVFPAAFSLATGSMHWELLARSRAYDTNCFVAMCGQARNHEDPTAFQAWGHSMICDPFGSILSQTGYEEDIMVCKIDLGKNEEIRNQIPVWNQKRYGELYDLVLSSKK